MINSQGHSIQHYIDVVENYFEGASVTKTEKIGIANHCYNQELMTSQTIDYCETLF